VVKRSRLIRRGFTFAAGVIVAVGIIASSGTPVMAATGDKRHDGSVLFGPRVCGTGTVGNVSATICQKIGGDFVMEDYAKNTGHNQYISRMGAQFVSAMSIHNPWIDFDYYGTDGRQISHWQGPATKTAHNYIRRVYPPAPYTYYNFGSAGNLCATLYNNPGQFPVKVSRVCLSVGPQS
jgi:hypothetical protein